MAVSDQFRASLPEDAGGTDAAAGGGRKRKDESNEAPPTGSPEAAGAGTEGTGEGSAPPRGASAGAGAGASAGAETPRRRASKRSAEDTEALLKRLEQAGFSRAEAARLIFERARPREEGLVRT